MLGELDLLTAERGKRQVGNFEIGVERGRAHAGVSRSGGRRGWNGRRWSGEGRSGEREQPLVLELLKAEPVTGSTSSGRLGRLVQPGRDLLPERGVLSRRAANATSVRPMSKRASNSFSVRSR